jgi:hypothetical protein
LPCAPTGGPSSAPPPRPPPPPPPRLPTLRHPPAAPMGRPKPYMPPGRRPPGHRLLPRSSIIAALPDVAAPRIDGLLPPCWRLTYIDIASRIPPPSAVRRPSTLSHATPRVRSCFCGRHLPPRCGGGPASAGSRHSTGHNDGEEPLHAERGTATECGHGVDARPRNTARPLVLLWQASASTVRRRRDKCGVARSH